MQRLSTLQACILLAVAKYYFLTNSQLELMGFGRRDTIRKATCFLASHPPKKPLLLVQKFPPSARTGRMEHVYGISETGLETVGGLTGAIPRTNPSQPFYDADYWHRGGVITFQFLLDKSLNQTSPEFKVKKVDHYFLKNGANHRTVPGPRLEFSTKVLLDSGGYFIPDSIYVLARNQTHILFTLEYVRGDKTGRTLNQIRNHMQALGEGAVSKKWNLPGQDFLSLFLFQDPRLKDRIIQVLRGNTRFRPFRNHFLFASYEDMVKDVFSCWRSMENQNIHFITGKPILDLSTL